MDMIRHGSTGCKDERHNEKARVLAVAIWLLLWEACLFILQRTPAGYYETYHNERVHEHLLSSAFPRESAARAARTAPEGDEAALAPPLTSLSRGC